MSLALALGRRAQGRAWPNPAVGAVIVRYERGEPVIVGRGWTQPGGRPHAETEALQRAGSAAAGATMYVTLEPCSHHGKTPPCADAIIAARIARVVSALEDPNPEVNGRGHAKLRAAGIPVDVGIGRAEARRAHAGHIMRLQAGRPLVNLKLAVSADGKAGLPGRRPANITGDLARARAQAMRAMHDAILVGIGTVLSDDPQLTCRLPGMEQRSPIRVVLDADLRLPETSHLATTARTTRVWAIAGWAASAARERALRGHGVDVLRVGQSDGRLDLATMLKLLAGRGITRLMVEGGPTVAASFVAADLVDEATLFRSPNAIGEGGIDALEGRPLAALTHSDRLQLSGKEVLGADRLEMYERV